MEDWRGTKRWGRLQCRGSGPSPREGQGGAQGETASASLFSSAKKSKRSRVAPMPSMGLTRVTVGAWAELPACAGSRLPLLGVQDSPPEERSVPGRARMDTQGWGLKGAQRDEVDMGTSPPDATSIGRSRGMSRAGPLPGRPEGQEEELPRGFLRGPTPSAPPGCCPQLPSPCAPGRSFLFQFFHYFLFL